MAEKRMFSKAIVASARFLKMPSTTRLFYYDLGMAADDDGIVEAFNVMRLTGATEDDLRVLVSKGYVRILNDDLVAQIVDWKKNNLIRGDRYQRSVYATLLQENNEQMLHYNQVTTNGLPSDNQVTTNGLPSDNQVTTNGLPSDNQVTTNGLPSDNQVTYQRFTQDRLGKDSIGKDSIGKDSITLSCSPTTKRDAERREKKYPSKQEVREYAAEIGSMADPDIFFEVYNAAGWVANGNPVKNWKALFIAWANARAKNRGNRALNFNQGVEYTVEDLKKMGIGFGEEFYEEGE